MPLQTGRVGRVWLARNAPYRHTGVTDNDDPVVVALALCLPHRAGNRTPLLTQNNTRTEGFSVSQQSLKASVASDGSGPQPAQQPNADVTYTTVYTFVIYDHDKGATAIYPRMATRRTIANMRGKVNEETAWVVDVTEVDSMGFYVGEKTPGKG
jgi:hypothetical protein